MRNFIFLSILFGLALGVVYWEAGGFVHWQPDEKISFYWTIVLLYLGIITWGVVSLSSSIFLRAYPRKRIPGKIAITIDDGPDEAFTTDLLALLRRYKIQATFFCVGREAEKYPHLLQQIVDEGHTIGMHGYTHSPFSNFQLGASWEKEFLQAEKALSPYLTHRWFRPPMGLMSPHLAQVIRKRQYTTILFHARAWDFGNRRIPNLCHRLWKNLSPGGILLLHGALPPGAGPLEKSHILLEMEAFFQKIDDSLYQIVSLEDYLREDSQKTSVKEIL